MARDWHDKKLLALGKMSFDLHEKLAQEHGAKTWDFRRLDAFSVNQTVKRSSSSFPIQCDWVNHGLVKKSQLIGNKADNAQCHPLKFTKAMFDLAREKGMKYINGHVLRIGKNELIFKKKKQIYRIAFDKVLVTAGPWTKRVLPDLDLQLVPSRAHSIVVKTETPVQPVAIFADITLKDGTLMEPEIYPRQDEVYACGDCGALDPHTLPIKASGVEVDEAKCDEIKQALDIISPDVLAKGEVTAKQACYLPLSNYPIMYQAKQGLYVSTGHGVWGITLAPGSGKVMADLIMDGHVNNLDMRAFQPA